MAGHERRVYSDEEKASGLALLASHGGDVSKAARAAGVPRRTLQRWRDETPEVVAQIARARLSVADASWSVAFERILNHRLEKGRRSGTGRSPIAAGSSCVYLVACDGFHKIGVSSNLPARLAALQTSCPHDVTLIDLATVGSQRAALDLEARLHQEFEHRRHRGEWFALEAAEVEAAIRLLAEGGARGEVAA